MTSLMLEAGASYLVSFRKPLLEDHELRARVALTGRGWAGVTCHPLEERLYLVSADERRIRRTDLRGNPLAGKDIETRGFGRLRDIVYAGPGSEGRSVFYLVEERSFVLVRAELGPRTTSLAAKDCARFALTGVPGAPALGSQAPEGAGLEGLGLDAAGRRLLVAREGEARVYGVPLAGLEALRPFPLADQVGKVRGDGGNHRVDVEAVQERLVELGYLSGKFRAGKPDEPTLEAIARFQKAIGIRRPDRNIKPGKRTHRGLMGQGWDRPAEGVELLDGLVEGGGLRDLTGLCVHDPNKQVFGGTREPARMLFLSRSGGEVVEAPLDQGLKAALSRLALGDAPAEGLAMDARRRLYVVCGGSPEQLLIFAPPGVELAAPQRPTPPPRPAPTVPASPVGDEPAPEGSVEIVPVDDKLVIDDEGMLRDPAGLLPDLYHFPPPVPDKKIKNRNKSIEWVVVHYNVTYGDHRKAHGLYRPGKRNLRTHFLIGRSGGVSQLCTVFEKTYHAGGAKPRDGDWKPIHDYVRLPWKVGGDCNKRSVGVDFCNYGYVTKYAKNPIVRFDSRQPLRYPDGTDTGYRYKKKEWESYTPAQLKSFVLMMRALVERFPQLTKNRFVGHDNVHKSKSDPGPAFPFPALLGQIFAD